MSERSSLVRLSRALALALVGALPAPTSAQQSLTAASLVFDGATVVDVEQGKLLPDQRVVVAGNRIRVVGSRGAVQMPQGARVVDARGKYLIPGLWDMHIHPAQLTDVYYPLLVANGVTGIRDAGSPVPLDMLRQWRAEILAGNRVGPPRQLLSGPPIETSDDEECVRDSNNGYANKVPMEDWTHYYTCVSADSADARRLVDSLRAAGVDMLKAHNMTQSTYFALLAAARRTGVPVGGHIVVWRDSVFTPATAAQVSDSGIRILDHVNSAADLDGLCVWRNGLFPEGAGAAPFTPFSRPATDSANLEQCRLVAERLRRNNTWWVPTLDVYQQGGSESLWLVQPGARQIMTRLAEHARAYWRDSVPNPYAAEHTGGAPAYHTTPVVPDSLRLLHIVQQANVPLLAGTDVAPPWWKVILPGFALHAELAIYVAEGLTPLAALRSATLNPAKMLGATDSLGTVAPGKLADLVLLDADPLVDIANVTKISAVMANGRYFDRVALDRLLSEARAKAKQSP